MKYCGLKEILPDGYDRFGSRYECLKTGIGVGKNLQNGNVRRKPINYMMLFIIIILIVIVIAIIYLLYKSIKSNEKNT